MKYNMFSSKHHLAHTVNAQQIRHYYQLSEELWSLDVSPPNSTLGHGNNLTNQLAELITSGTAAGCPMAMERQVKEKFF